MNDTRITLYCECQKVQLEVRGTPIISVECLCSDCQSAGKQLQTLPNAHPILEPSGATGFVLYRKDRIQILKGQALLAEHRLLSSSSTRRVISSCCHTPIFLEFSKGHWLSVYRNLWPRDSRPKIELRTMTRSKKEGVELPDDVPNPKTHTVFFYFKLLRAWAAMGFRSPAMDFIEQKLTI